MLQALQDKRQKASKTSITDIEDFTFCAFLTYIIWLGLCRHVQYWRKDTFLGGQKPAIAWVIYKDYEQRTRKLFYMIQIGIKHSRVEENSFQKNRLGTFQKRYWPITEQCWSLYPEGCTHTTHTPEQKYQRFVLINNTPCPWSNTLPKIIADFLITFWIIVWQIVL